MASKLPLAHLADRRVGDVPDVAFPPLEPVDLRRVDVEPQDRDPAVAEGAGQRQADVAQADDPDTHRRRFDPGSERPSWEEPRKFLPDSPPYFSKRKLTVLSWDISCLDRTRDQNCLK